MKKIAVLTIILFLSVVFTGSAFALKVKFEGAGDWLANDLSSGPQYLDVSGGDTGVLANETFRKIKAKGLRFLSTTPSDEYLFKGFAFEIDPSKGIPKKAAKRNWSEEKINEKLAGKVFKIKLKAENGTKYKGKLTFGELTGLTELPPPPSENAGALLRVASAFEEENGTGGGSHPVSEPATMLLLGAGILGLAGIRRIRKR